MILITIDQYCGKYNKKTKQVIEWIGLGYIPGCVWNNENWNIPDNARLPYTERRNPQGYAVYKSFVKAYYKGKNATPGLYSMTIERFENINRQLVEWGLTSEEKLDGMVYYNATPQGVEFISFTKNQLYIFIQQSLNSISSGIASGIFSK